MPEEINSSIESNESNESNARPELSPKPADKRPIIYGFVGVLLVIILFGGIGWLLFVYPDVTTRLRDIVIIFLGLGALFVILLLIALVVITAYLVIKVNDLVKLLDREIKPPLVKLQETIGTVRGTTTFISDQAVQPVISTISNATAIRTIIRTLFTRN